jgi:DNA-binding GntR family transcriptional regulator
VDVRKIAVARPPSLTAAVTERLKSAIIDAEFKLGEALSEDKLAASLGVSRTPVREALSALQLQGLIDIAPQRGSYVFLPSEVDVAELCEFRVMMEGRAMALCHARAKDPTLAAMRRANAAMEDAEIGSNHLASAYADSDFHTAFFDNCGNQYLVKAYGLISGRIATLRTHLLMPQAGMRSGPISEHAQLIDAFAAGKLSDAEAILSTHIYKMRERFRQTVERGLLPKADDGPAWPSLGSNLAPT